MLIKEGDNMDFNRDKKSKENLYKILRMNLYCNASENDRETNLKKFEEITRDLDAMDQEEYENKISDFFYTALSLERRSYKIKKTDLFCRSTSQRT